MNKLLFEEPDKYDFLVSIICVTYNHEKYLKYALDGVLMQKTNFPFEVIIAEDCSTDNSRKIINSYCQKYPGFFKVIYRSNNVGSKQNVSEADQMSTGKYIIHLETDDFWTDPYKLQKQADWLENHPDDIAVTHLCNMVDKDNAALPLEYPSTKGGYYRFSDLRREKLPGQTATMMYRNYVKYGKFDASLDKGEKRAKGPGDRRKCFMLLTIGAIYCIPEYMSSYRFVTSGGSSFSANNKQSFSDDILYYKQFLDYAQSNKLQGEALYTAEFLYIRSLWIAFLHRQTNIVNAKKLFSSYKFIKNKFRSTLNVVWFYLERVIKKDNYYYKKKKR